MRFVLNLINIKVVASSALINYATGWGRSYIVSFQLRPRYSPWKSPLYPFRRRLDGVATDLEATKERSIVATAGNWSPGVQSLSSYFTNLSRSFKGKENLYIACYSVQELLPSHIILWKLIVKMLKRIIVPLFVYGSRGTTQHLIHWRVMAWWVLNLLELTS
jgi:hypothetical protein